MPMFSSPPEAVDRDLLHARVVAALRRVRDPELPVNIYDLGLVYALYVGLEGWVDIVMTLTTPACPVSRSLPAEVERVVRAVPGVTSCTLHLVWEPPWGRERMSPAARAILEL